MKKVFSLITILFLPFVFAGCHPSSSPESPTISIYIYAEILNADKEILYSSNTEPEKIPILNLQDDYYLRLHVGPGATFVFYENTKISVYGSEIIVREIAEKSGQLYTLKGIRECENTKIEITLPKTKVTCHIYVSFS